MRRSADGRIGGKAVILFYLTAHKQATAAELRAAIEEAGYKSSTFAGLIWTMKRDGLVLHSTKGYSISSKGLKKLDEGAE
jgi:DNA-binding IclR family transcriptional regulator